MTSSSSVGHEPSGAVPSTHGNSPVVARTLERIICAVEPVVRVIAGVGILLLMVATALDVAARVITGRSLPGVIEITEVMLVVTVYFSLVTAGRDGRHIRVVLLTERLPTLAARVVRSFGLTIALGIVCWMIWATTGTAIASVSSGEYRIGLAHVPIWPARIAIPIGLSLLALLLLFLLLSQILKFSSPIGRETQPFEDLLQDPIEKDRS